MKNDFSTLQDNFDNQLSYNLEIFDYKNKKLLKELNEILIHSDDNIKISEFKSKIFFN